MSSKMVIVSSSSNNPLPDPPHLGVSLNHDYVLDMSGSEKTLGSDTTKALEDKGVSLKQIHFKVVNKKTDPAFQPEIQITVGNMLYHVNLVNEDQGIIDDPDALKRIAMRAKDALKVIFTVGQGKDVIGKLTVDTNRETIDIDNESLKKKWEAIKGNSADSKKTSSGPSKTLKEKVMKCAQKAICSVDKFTEPKTSSSGIDKPAKKRLDKVEDQTVEVKLNTFSAHFHKLIEEFNKALTAQDIKNQGIALNNIQKYLENIKKISSGLDLAQPLVTLKMCTDVFLKNFNVLLNYNLGNEIKQKYDDFTAILNSPIPSTAEYCQNQINEITQKSNLAIQVFNEQRELIDKLSSDFDVSIKQLLKRTFEENYIKAINLSIKDIEQGTKEYIQKLNDRIKDLGPPPRPFTTFEQCQTAFNEAVAKFNQSDEESKAKTISEKAPFLDQMQSQYNAATEFEDDNAGPLGEMKTKLDKALNEFKQEAKRFLDKPKGLLENEIRKKLSENYEELNEQFWGFDGISNQFTDAKEKLKAIQKEHKSLEPVLKEVIEDDKPFEKSRREKFEIYFKKLDELKSAYIADAKNELNKLFEAYESVKEASNEEQEVALFKIGRCLVKHEEILVGGEIGTLREKFNTALIEFQKRFKSKTTDSELDSELSLSPRPVKKETLEMTGELFSTTREGALSSIEKLQLELETLHKQCLENVEAIGESEKIAANREGAKDSTLEELVTAFFTEIGKDKYNSETKTREVSVVPTQILTRLEEDARNVEEPRYKTLIEKLKAYSTKHAALIREMAEADVEHTSVVIEEEIEANLEGFEGYIDQVLDLCESNWGEQDMENLVKGLQAYYNDLSPEDQASASLALNNKVTTFRDEKKDLVVKDKTGLSEFLDLLESTFLTDTNMDLDSRSVLEEIPEDELYSAIKKKEKINLEDAIKNADEFIKGDSHVVLKINRLISLVEAVFMSKKYEDAGYDLLRDKVGPLFKELAELHPSIEETLKDYQHNRVTGLYTRKQGSEELDLIVKEVPEDELYSAIKEEREIDINKELAKAKAFINQEIPLVNKMNRVMALSAYVATLDSGTENPKKIQEKFSCLLLVLGLKNSYSAKEELKFYKQNEETGLYVLDQSLLDDEQSLLYGESDDESERSL